MPWILHIPVSRSSENDTINTSQTTIPTNRWLVFFLYIVHYIAYCIISFKFLAELVSLSFINFFFVFIDDFTTSVGKIFLGIFVSSIKRRRNDVVAPERKKKVDTHTGSKMNLGNKDIVETQTHQFHFKSTKANKHSQSVKLPIVDQERYSSNNLHDTHYDANNCIPNAAEYRKPFDPDFLGSTMLEGNDELEALIQTNVITR